jgi:phosphonate degradation associated HDIG domain protein
MTELDDVFDLYDRFGGETYDEDVAQLHHALQTAALATSAGASDALVAAALLHDIGHLLALQSDGEPVGPHQRSGPAFLAGLFPAGVTDPITLHVAAKRYLCSAEPAYRSSLSAGSVRSLAHQGGPMSADEMRAFTATPGWRDAVALRRWDDAGKLEDAEVPDLARYQPLLRGLACYGS